MLLAEHGPGSCFTWYALAQMCFLEGSPAGSYATVLFQHQPSTSLIVLLFILSCSLQVLPAGLDQGNSHLHNMAPRGGGVLAYRQAAGTQDDVLLFQHQSYLIALLFF